MKILSLLIILLTGCALKESEGVSKGFENIEKIALYNRSYNGNTVIAQGYYWPSYEGSVICQTRKFENCLLVVFNEKNYRKYKNEFEKGDFVMVSGRFKWADIEEIKKNIENSKEIIPYYPYHRIVGVKSVKRVNN
jgi:hypothetical protein